MKNLQEVYKECLKELDDINIKYGNISAIYTNARFKSTWGKCRLDKKHNTYKIEINPCLLNDDISDISLKDTIIHEILHTCKNCLNHGTEWKRLANIVNKKYPQYHIKRTTSAKEKEVEHEYKYILECTLCKRRIGYHRISNAVKHPEYYTCKCSRKSKLMRIK